MSEADLAFVRSISVMATQADRCRWSKDGTHAVERATNESAFIVEAKHKVTVGRVSVFEGGWVTGNLGAQGREYRVRPQGHRWLIEQTSMSWIS